MIDHAAIKLRYEALDPLLDERGRRRFAAAEALPAGLGGVAAVSRITVGHLPPGTSKWNKIEHRLFSFITQNWRGRPLVTYQTIDQLIAAATMKAGLKVRAKIDTNTYPAGIKVTDAEMDEINIQRHDFHGEWNYTSSPPQPK